jgi:hypothetical protein
MHLACVSLRCDLKRRHPFARLPSGSKQCSDFSNFHFGCINQVTATCGEKPNDGKLSAFLLMMAAMLATDTLARAQLPAPPTDPSQRHVYLVKQDQSDCTNSHVANADSPLVAGHVWVTRSNDGHTGIKVAITAKPRTTYHFFLKCVRKLAEITTDDEGVANVSLSVPTSTTGDSFAFDMYPEGAPLGNKFQSAPRFFQISDSSPHPMTHPSEENTMLRTLASLVFTGAALNFLFIAQAQAQATRTWVSGAGDDANTVQPYRSMQDVRRGYLQDGRATAKSTASIRADSVPWTITKSITIDCREEFGSILYSGTNGINVALTVSLRTTLANGAPAQFEP